MPELPDVTIYVEALRKRIVGERLRSATVRSPFLLRSTTPPLASGFGRRVVEVTRLAKRIGIALEGDLWLVLHLMIAGRLHWSLAAPKRGGRNLLALFEFDHGWLTLTEAGTRRRAALWIVPAGELAGLRGDALEPLTASLAQFVDRLRAANHTLKRALTDPHIISGIGNAYSDEILFRARLSPVAMTRKLSEGEIERLYQATRDTLSEWIARLRAETGDAFPEHVTAFRPAMAVHGRYRAPCPVCGSPIQRIRHADNETNYCATCQTAGRLLADRALSRLLHQDWPRTLDELEARRRP